MPKRDLPDDVEPDQVGARLMGSTSRWSSSGTAWPTLNRCTPAGRVLNASYRTNVEVERMQEEYKLVTT